MTFIDGSTFIKKIFNTKTREKNLRRGYHFNSGITMRD